MKKVVFFALLLISVTCLVSETAVKAEGLVSNAVNNAAGAARDSFLHSIGDYFSVPQTAVTTVVAQSIPDEQIPVVFYMARQAKVAPVTITALRLQGQSWQRIANFYNLGPEIFYVPVNANVVIGPPYGHAYGYYKNKPRKEWSTIKLADADIVNLVNLKFISEHYKYPPETIMKMRQKNAKFYTINNDIEKHKNANKKIAKAAPAKKAKVAPGQVKKQKAAPGQAKNQKAVKKQKTDKKTANLMGARAEKKDKKSGNGKGGGKSPKAGKGKGAHKK